MSSLSRTTLRRGRPTHPLWLGRSRGCGRGRRARQGGWRSCPRGFFLFRGRREKAKAIPNQAAEAVHPEPQTPIPPPRRHRVRLTSAGGGPASSRALWRAAGASCEWFRETDQARLSRRHCERRRGHIVPKVGRGGTAESQIARSHRVELKHAPDQMRKLADEIEGQDV